jgi:PAS domain S-box-containing protein
MKKISTLYIEDDGQQRQKAEELLRDRGFKVVLTPVEENGMENLQSATSANLKRVKTLEDQIKELERKAISLGMANIDMLAIQEQLEEKNREMEKLLAELSQRTDELQAILDTSPSAIVMIDRDNTITAANQRVKDFFGISREKVINRSFEIFINKIKPCFEDFDLYRQYAGEIEEFCLECDPQAVNIREMYSRAVKIIKPKTRIVAPLTASVKDKDEKELGRIWIYNDITELKRADELLRTIVETSPYPIVVSRFDDGKILFANEPTAELLGTSPSEIIGLSTPDFYADPAERQRILKILAEKGTVRDREVQIKKYDGETVWMIFSLVTTELNGEKVVIGALSKPSGCMMLNPVSLYTSVPLSRASPE